MVDTIIRLQTEFPIPEEEPITIFTSSPTVGGGAQIDNISPGVRDRIQRIADKYGIEITVVGSRAAGTAGAASDWDYIIGGRAKERSNAKRELPRDSNGGELDASGRETGIDGWNAANYPVDQSKPYITFLPR
jgi:hypothetical protein